MGEKRRGLRMESWGTGAFRDGQKRSRWKIPRRGKPEGRKRTRRECCGDGKRWDGFKKWSRVSYAEEGQKDKVSVRWAVKGRKRKLGEEETGWKVQKQRGPKMRKARIFLGGGEIIVPCYRFFLCKLEIMIPTQDAGILHFQIPNQKWDSVSCF